MQIVSSTSGKSITNKLFYHLQWQVNVINVNVSIIRKLFFECISYMHVVASPPLLKCGHEIFMNYGA